MTPKVIRYTLILWYRTRENHVILLSELPRKFQCAPVTCSLHGEEIIVLVISEDMDYLQKRILYYQMEQEQASNAQETTNSPTASKETVQGLNSSGTAVANISQKFQLIMGKAAKHQKSLEIGSDKPIITNKKVRKANCPATVTSPNIKIPNLDQSSLQECSSQNDMLSTSMTNNPLSTSQSYGQQSNNEIPQINDCNVTFQQHMETMLPPFVQNTDACIAVQENNSMISTTNYINNDISQHNIVHGEHEICNELH